MKLSTYTLLVSASSAMRMEITEVAKPLDCLWADGLCTSKAKLYKGEADMCAEITVEAECLPLVA